MGLRGERWRPKTWKLGLGERKTPSVGQMQICTLTQRDRRNCWGGRKESLLLPEEIPEARRIRRLIEEEAKKSRKKGYQIDAKTGPSKSSGDGKYENS